MMQKTTLIAILTALATIIGAGASFLSTGTFDAPTVVGSVIGLLTALGFYHAADSR